LLYAIEQANKAYYGDKDKKYFFIMSTEAPQEIKRATDKFLNVTVSEVDPDMLPDKNNIYITEDVYEMPKIDPIALDFVGLYEKEIEDKFCYEISNAYKRWGVIL